MPIDPTQIPDMFIPEIPADRTFDELRQEVEGKECIVMFIQDTWIYTTLVQDIVNGLRSIFAGSGFKREFSIGSAIRVCFYFVVDTPTATDPRVITINHTVEFRPVCMLSITAVRQNQIEVRRQWVKWCLTLNYEDDTQSAAVQTAVLAVASLLGIGAQGIASVLSGTSGALSGLADLIGKQEQQYVFVSRETADGGTLWVDSGPPTSSAVFGPARISDEMCEALVQVFGSGGGTTTIRAPTLPVPPGGD